MKLARGYRRHLLPAVGIALLFAGSAQSHAAESHQHKEEMEHHGSHEHGAARLTLATTDSGLEVTLESPAANLFGFEHAAHSDEEHHVVHEAVEKLSDGGALFVINQSAGCLLSDTDIESSVVAQHQKERHGADDHDEHKHDDHNDHKDDDHDDHKHDDHDHGEGSHSDVEVVWTFQCQKTAAIELLDTGLFKAFPAGFEHLVVEWIGATSAGQVELEKDGKIRLR